MSITFQKQAKQEHSVGSLLLGAIFGGVSDELNMIMDTCEVASEFHTYNHQKQQNKGTFQLGQKNSLGSTFAANNNRAPEATGAELNGFQKIHTPHHTYQPRSGMGMKMAA